MAKKNIIKRMISSPLVQTFLIYISGGWIALELTDYIINNYGLNEKFREVLSIILLFGLPLAIFTTWYLGREKEEVKAKDIETTSDRKSSGILKTIRKKLWFTIPGVILLILLLITGIRYIHRQIKIAWINEHAIPKIEQLASADNFTAAYQIALKAEKYLPEDPRLIDIFSRVSSFISIQTDPPGADIYIKEYSAIESDWQFLGQSPIDDLRMPVYIFYRWKIEKEGYETAIATASTNVDTLHRKLDETGSIPHGMVRVTGQNTDEGMIPDFFLDKYEVSNKLYKEFLDAGGYQKPEYWKHKFVKDGGVLTWEEAMAELRDETGRPGPANWQAEDYPDGEDEYPVTGVSWYEAAAYAEFVGKSLPTIQHWDIAAGFNIPSNGRFPSRLIPLSNFEGSGPLPVGSSQGTNCFGAYDMAGNVREWCWNESQEGRFIQGGAWDDASYMYSSKSQLPPFDRSPKNGIRCVRYFDIDIIADNVFQPVLYTGIRDYYEEKIVTDAVFQVYKNQFSYDKSELDADVDESYESSDDWTIERITFNAAYENERMIAYLYLPKNTTPPYQTIIYFPGSGAKRRASFRDYLAEIRFIPLIVKTGRAVMFPVYKGTLERQDGLTYEREKNQSHRYTEYLVKCVKDFSRSIDYLETRTDIDIDNLAYLGSSWGGRTGAIIPAVEERLRVSILLAGGLSPFFRAFPEADEINYISRVKNPVLMLNGKYDYIFPLEKSVFPMFKLLGTPKADKFLKIYESDHYVPRNEFIKETLTWLDRYLGPVNK